MNVPDLFTVSEVAAILRVGRSTAYELAARDLATGGGEGLGVVRVGGQLRVRRAALEALVGGPVSWPIVEERVGAVGEGIGEVGEVVPLTVVPSPSRHARFESCFSPSLPFGS